MQVTETSAEGLRRELKIVVPAGEIAEQISRRLGEIGRSVRLPGFRPGKVPMQILQRRFGPAVRGEVLESTLQGSSAEAMREQNLRPALPPKVEIVSAAEGGDLEYTISVEVLPDLPEPEFNDLGLERLVAEVPDADIDRALERLAEQQRKSEPVDRAAETGDIVIADVAGRIGEEEIPGSRAEGREIELGASGYLPGFSEQLVGVKAGEQRAVTVTFPEETGSPDLAGKEAVFDVAVKEVRQRLPAAIDDELAKAMGLENLTELRQEVQQRMQRDYDGISRQRLKRALLDKLAERYDFPVPPGMVEMEFESIWRQYLDDKEPQKEAAAEPPDSSAESPAADEAKAEPAADEAKTDPAVDADEEEQKAEYRRIAERRVRLGLLLAEVGRNNNINVTQDELNRALAREAQRLPGYERQVLDYYRKNPDAVNNLRAPIFEEKVVDFIIEMAKVEERKVAPQELMSMPDNDGAEAGESRPA
jgi:trigger factor